MKQITLTNGMKTQVDNSDFDRLNTFTWSFHRSGRKGGYAGRRVGSRRKRTVIWIFIHREIMKPGDGIKVDHKDRNKLNNQRFNLRLASDQKNSWNASRKRKNQFIGVQVARSGRYQAKIMAGKKNTYIGTFDTAEQAARAYDQRAVTLRGEFALTNFA